MKRRCDHCHLEYDEDALFRDESFEDVRFFCCKGCQGVYHLLRSSGLDSFYDKLGSSTLEPPKELDSQLSRFDSEAFTRQYIKQESGISTISLIISNIHCAACVWLNEKILHQQNGIIEASINYTNNKAVISWDSSKIALSQIIALIRSIGYDAHPYDPKTQEERAHKARRDYYTRMVVGIFCTMNIMWIAIAQWAGYFSGMDSSMRHILNFASFMLATPALFFSGWIFFRGAYYGLKHGLVGMDLLVASGASMAYFYSIYAAISGAGETYFDSVAMIITFVLMGKFLEIKGKKSAVDSLDALEAQIPSTVIVLQNEKRIAKAPDEVIVGDVIEVLPGERLALDGILLSEHASIDESALSGESLPVEKCKNDEILSGAINLENAITYRVSRIFGDSLMSNIIHLIEDSLSKKPHIETRANELARYFSIIVLTLSLVTFVAWIYIGKNIEVALITAISVVIVACPCALALATPIASLVALSESLKKKLLFKEARFFETIAKADLLVIDKTGTLTHAKPSVVDVQRFLEFDSSTLLALVKSSAHPISRGVARFLEEKGIIETPLLESMQIPARGLVGIDNDGIEWLGGNLSFLNERGIDTRAISPTSRLQFAIAYNGNLVAVFGLEDEIKSDAKSAIESIQKLGIEVVMLTGDHEDSAREVANKLKIAYKAELTPSQKAEYVRTAHDHGRVVVMAGDGINDAPALALSDIAVAMSGGMDVAIGVSDVVVMDNSLGALSAAFALSRRTFALIKQNIAISLFYNALTIPLAMLGYVIPLIAAVAMSMSSLLVVGNSWRIKGKLSL